MKSANEIRQEMILRAPRAAVWSALSTPDGWTGWFSDGVEGRFEVGETLILDFGRYGKSRAKVVEREEMSSFAYQWHPGGDGNAEERPDEEMTTVRFTLEDHPEGTRLVLVERGFDQIPEPRRHRALDDNTGGWRFELGELQTFLEDGRRQMLSSEGIVRQRVYPVSADKLWDLVATPKGLASWFVSSVEGDLSPGSLSLLVFSPEVSGPIKVVTREPKSRFEFQWHPGQEMGCTWDQFPETEATTVSFEVAPGDGGAHLTMIESGFQNVPESRRAKALESNAKGWTEVMDMIGKAVEGGS